jgi:predicted metal-dependent peptidase
MPGSPQPPWPLLENRPDPKKEGKMNMTPQQKFAAARAMACNRQPYLASALLSLIPIWRQDFQTLAVSKSMHVLIGIPAIERWTVTQICTAIIHEVWHPLRTHHARAEAMASSCHCSLSDIARDWNTAADCEINDDLVAGGLEFPDGYGVVPDGIGMPDGRAAEEYFRHIRKNGRPPTGAPGKGQKGPKKSGGKKPSPGEGEEEGEEGQGGTGDRPGVGTGWCGSAGGAAVDGEPTDEEIPGRSEAEIKQIQRSTAEAIASASNNGRGRIPAGLQRWADEMIKPPKIPWQQKLARACRGSIATRAGTVDYKYTRPARRQGGMGYGVGRPVLPALRAPVPRVWFIVDTSGSMGRAELERAASEADGVIRATGCDVTILTNDAEVHGMRTVRNVRQALDLFIGGGGTDFRPPFAAAEKSRAKPDLIVFATDGMGPAPAVAPRGVLQTIWVLVGPHRTIPYSEETRTKITWGEFIEIDDEEEKTA